VRDQVDVVSVPAVDGAQHALAEPRCVPDDPVEYRRKIGRRVGDEAQDLGCRGLALSGLLKFEGESFDFGLRWIFGVRFR
jgi:hypothetical protein